MNRPAMLTALVLTSTLALHSVAKADEGTTSRATVEPGYAYQIVLADVVAAAATITALNTSIDTVEDLAFVPFATFSPAVHLIHGNPGRAAASLGLHTAVPFAFAYVGSRLQSCGEDEWLCGLEGAGIGLMVGMVTATLIDASLLARPKRVEKTNMAFTVAPSFAITPSGGTTIGFVGTM